MRTDTRQRALSAPGLTTARTENPDPLLALLQCYEAELACRIHHGSVNFRGVKEFETPAAWIRGTHLGRSF